MQQGWVFTVTTSPRHSIMNDTTFSLFPYLVQIVRNKVAAWLLARPDANKLTSTTVFREQLDALADGRQLMQSATRLAHHRPLYTAAITGKLFMLPFAP